MNVLGVNAYHADVSAVLLVDGELVAAVEEERFRRIKHVAGFPTESVRACLRMAGVEGGDIHHVAISRNPRAHAWRKGLFALTHRPSAGLLTNRAANYRRVEAIPQTLAEVLDLPAGARGPFVHWVEHHPAHLASAFFVSPYEEAAVCAIDGFGDFVSTSRAHGVGTSLDVVDRTFFPHSLGLLYLAVTQHLGFTSFGDEFKVMGLAPYGAPEFKRQLSKIITLGRGGRFELDLSYFTHWSGGAPMTWDDGAPTLGRVFTPKLEQILGPARQPDQMLTERHDAIAASIQAVFEDTMFHILNALHDQVPAAALCLAGGCAMNSVANGKIREQTPFQQVFVQPAAADNGTALGAAFWVWHQVLKRPRSFVMKHALLGPEFDETDVNWAMSERAGDLARASCKTRRLGDSHSLCEFVADRLAAGQVVGWFQGRMEWGARALGNRSILADPRRDDMRDIINTKIKFRERFRPFAPSVLEEARNQYFVDATPDPFMMQVRPIFSEKQPVIPAVTHVDGSGRLQTVNVDSNPLYWELIRAFERRTGVPMLLNTSFNENEPIVHRPEEALDCFLRTGMDVLVMGTTVVTKPD
ncbi:MAG TPA: carbamoyltransferase C-terminal domain-containing protein [Vicinamibacterales bacterium]|nr:carbamoyltransferase C-terminal domain-containing protein [Vicinamibacterales bacterium]